MVSLRACATARDTSCPAAVLELLYYTRPPREQAHDATGHRIERKRGKAPSPRDAIRDTPHPLGSTARQLPPPFPAVTTVRRKILGRAAEKSGPIGDWVRISVAKMVPHLYGYASLMVR